MNALHSFKRLSIVLVLIAAVLFGAARPASAFLDKTRFALHLGVAYFAFHHWVLKPYQEGSFAQGAPHRTAAIVKAGVAALFAWHEVRVSQHIADVSKDPLLHKLSGGVASFASTLAAAGSAMKAGHFNPGDIAALNGQSSQLQQNAQANGVTIKDRAVAIPGT